MMLFYYSVVRDGKTDGDRQGEKRCSRVAKEAPQKHQQPACASSVCLTFSAHTHTHKLNLTSNKTRKCGGYEAPVVVRYIGPQYVYETRGSVGPDTRASETAPLSLSGTHVRCHVCCVALFPFKPHALQRATRRPSFFFFF